LVLNKKEKNMCVFCKIINGEIPSFKIYETEDLVAFLDISQATKGHTLIVPKKHFEGFISHLSCMENYLHFNSRTSNDVLWDIR
jgi:galactose-1-phosphate uridylyltransferase